MANDNDMKKLVVDSLNNGTVVNVSKDSSTQTAPVFQIGSNTAYGTTSGRTATSTTVTIAENYTDATTWGDGTGTVTYDNNSGYIHIIKPTFNLAHNKDSNDISILVREPLLGTLCFIQGRHWLTKEPDEHFEIDGDTLVLYKIEKTQILAYFNENNVDIAFGNNFSPVEAKTLINLLVQYGSEHVSIARPKQQHGAYEQRVDNIKAGIENLLGVQVNEN